MKNFLSDLYYAFYRVWRNKIRRFPRRVRWFIQRGRRGWSDEDAWGIYYYLGDIIPQMLRHMAETTCSYPGVEPYETPEKWRVKLNELADKIGAYREMSEMPDGWTGEKEEEAYKITQQGLKEMADIFGHLWD